MQPFVNLALNFRSHQFLELSLRMYDTFWNYYLLICQCRQSLHIQKH